MELMASYDFSHSFLDSSWRSGGSSGKIYIRRFPDHNRRDLIRFFDKIGASQDFFGDLIQFFYVGAVFASGDESCADPGRQFRSGFLPGLG
jgi:hypothetical protein